MPTTRGMAVNSARALPFRRITFGPPDDARFAAAVLADFSMDAARFQGLLHAAATTARTGTTTFRE